MNHCVNPKSHAAARFRAVCVALFLCVLPAQVSAQACLLRQQNLAKWGIASADYSAITPLGGGRYAVVSDKERRAGFRVWRIVQGADGQVVSVKDEGFFGEEAIVAARDCEGLACMPQRGRVYVSGEADQCVVEHDMKGRLTGRELNVPPAFSCDSIRPNAGFEALCYDSLRDLLWLTTECTLPADGAAPSSADRENSNLLRLQAFTPDLQPSVQCLYRTDVPAIRRGGRLYVMGVSAMCALPDGRLLVLEREVNVPPRYVGAECRVKIYAVRPDASAAQPLPKQLVAAFSTHLGLFARSFANYEGMCPGAPTADGRPTLLLISDSQSGAGRGRVWLKDYIKVVVM